MEKWIDLSATALAKAIREKQISAEEAVTTFIERIETVNPKLNAVVQLTAEKAREEARQADAALARGEVRGPLHGVPFTLKDSIETAGVVTTGGTLGRASYIPTEDATVVRRLRSAGAILLGKTNCPELGWAWESDNLIYGRTNNPYNLSLSSGGSSGGEAAIIATGGSPLGLGSDAGGSVRFPAHCCGIAGIKPTAGRVPRTGHFPGPGGTLDALWQIGPLARSVEDLGLTLSVIAGVDWRDPAVVPIPFGDPKSVVLKPLRIAFHTDNGIVAPTAVTAEVVRKAAKVLTKEVAEVVETRPPGIEQTYEIFLAIFSADGGAAIESLLKSAGTTKIHSLMQQVLEIQRAHALSTAEFGAVVARGDALRRSMLSFMENFDVILCPVCAYPGMVHGATYERLQAFTYTMTYNLTGWPAAVVRGGTSPEGLPIGVQIVARPWREDVALATARFIESALGGWPPPRV